MTHHPEDVEIREIGSTALGSESTRPKRSPATSPGIRSKPGYDKVPHRDDESELPELSDEELASRQREARILVRRIADHLDRHD